MDIVDGEFTDDPFQDPFLVDIEDVARDQIQFLFEADEEWVPTINAETLDQLINQFGVNDQLYVSAAGFVDPRLDQAELVWPVTRAGVVGEPLEIEAMPDGAAVVLSVGLGELLDYAIFDDFDNFDEETGEFIGDNAAVPSNEDLSLVFDEVTFEGVSYGVAIDATDELSAVDEVSSLLWVAAAVLTGLSALATWVVASRALGPVDTLTRQVGEITATRLQDRLPGSERPDEIGRLAATMNRMLERLDASDRQRRQFVSDASHELRTPLAVLASQADAARTVPETTSLESLAQVVDGETTRLTSIVEDLLALARHDEMSLPGASDHHEPFDLDDVLLAEAARKRRLPVDRSAVSAGRVRGDALATARAIGHLLDNAARHGSSKIAIGLATAGDSVRLTVDDDGDGVPEADRRDIFDRFTRLDDARTRDGGGAGLGLSVVKATFAQMGGTVSVDRSPLGGARFEVVIPSG